MFVILDQAAKTGQLDRLAELEEPILRALAVGDTYGSPARLAALGSQDTSAATSPDAIASASAASIASRRGSGIG